MAVLSPISGARDVSSNLRITETTGNVNDLVNDLKEKLREVEQSRQDWQNSEERLKTLWQVKDRADGYMDSRGKRAPIVIFEKEIDGSHVVVEAVCDTKRNQNYIISEFIASKGVDQAKIKKALQAPMDAVADLRETSETLAADTFTEEAAHTSSGFNIAEDGETVNEESTNRAESAQEMRETEDGERQLRRTYGMGEEVTQEARQDRARRRLESWSVSETAAEGISEAAPAGIDAERYAAAASTMYPLGQMEDVGSFDRALELAGASSGIAQNVNYVLARQAGRSALEIAYTYGRGEAESGTRAARYGGAVTEKSYTGSGNVSYEGTLERSGSDAAGEIIRLNAAGTGTDAILRNVLANDTDVKAYVDTTAAKIYFGDRAQDIFGTVLHEDYHWYNSLDQAGAARLQEHALTYLASANGYETMDEMIRAKMADYAGQSLTYEEAAEELVADAWRGIFDTEESFGDWVEFQRGQAEKNGAQKSAIRKVMESVRDMLDGIIQKAKEILGVDPDNRAAKQAQKLAESEKEILRREYFEHAETAMENLRNKKAANEAAGAHEVRFALSEGESSIEQQLNDSLDELAEMDAVAEIDGTEVQYGTDTWENIEYIANYFDSIGGKVEREGFGVVELTRKGANNTVRHGYSEAKQAAVASIPEVIRQGKQIGYEQNWKNRGYETYVFAAPVKISGAELYEAVIVNSYQRDGRNSFYVHEVCWSDGSYVTLNEAGTPIKKEDTSAQHPMSVLSPISGARDVSSDMRITETAENVNDLKEKLREVEQSRQDWQNSEESRKVEADRAQARRHGLFSAEYKAFSQSEEYKNWLAQRDELNEQARTLKKQIETAEENAEKQVRFQRVEAADKAAKGNRQQQASRMIADKAQALDTLAQMMGITKGVRISEDSLVGLAEKWARENGARGKINTQELAGETRALAEYLKADGADMEKAASLSETIAGEILDAATVRNTDLWDEYQQLHRLTYTVDKNGQAKAELVKAYGSWGAAVKEARKHGVTLRQEANYRDGNPAEQYESIVNDVSAVSGAASGEAALFRSAAKDAGVDGALSMESTEWLEVLMNVHDAIKPTVESAFADVAEYEDARQVLAGQIIGDLMSVPEMTDAEAIFEQIQKRQREAAVRGAGSEEAAAETLKNLKKEQRAETRELKKTQRQIETDAAREEAQFGAAQAGIANLDANLELMGVDLATVGDVNEKLTVLREKYEQAWKEEKKRLREERRQMMDEIKLERRQAQADLYEMEQALKDETARANKAERSLLIQENEYAEWEAENERREEAWKQKQAERNVKAVELATRQAQEDAIRAKELADRRVQKARDGRRADELKRGIRNDAAALNQMLLRPSKGKYVNQTMITQAAEVAKMADAVTVNEKAILKLNTLQESIRREMGAESGTSIDWQNSGLDTLITTFRESVNAGKEAELARLQTQLAEAQALGESDETRALVERLEERIRRAEAKPYGRSLTVEQLRMLKAITSGTLHTIRTANKTVSLAQNLEVDAMAEKAAAEVKSSEGNSVARLDPEKAGSKLEAAKGAVKDTVLSFKLWTMSPQRMLNMIGGYTSGGTMQKLGDALNEGQHKQHEVIMKGEAMFAEVLSEETATERARFAGEGADLVDIGLTDTKGQKVKLNHAQLCSLWMHLKNEDSINHLAGQGFTVPNMTLYNQGKFEQAYQKGSTVLLTELNETLDPMNTAVTKLAKRVEAAMDDYDRAWCRKMQDFFNHYTTDLINGTSLQLLGYKMANVKNYYPISVDSSVLVKEINGETADATIEGRGFTKQRQKSTKPILLEECQNVVQRSLRDTADYVGLAAPIRDVNKVLNTPVDEYGGLLKNKVIREQWGSETVKTIDKLIRDLQSKSGAEQNPITKTWRKLRSNYAGAVLTSNTGVILSQVSGAIANAAVLDGEATMKTMGQFAKNFVPSEYRKLRAEMREHGDWEMDYRMRGNEGDTLEDVGGRKDSLIQKGVDLIPDALTFMDEISVSAAWTGAKSYVKRHAGEFEGNAGDVGSEAYWAAVNQKYREAMEKTQPNNGMMQIAARQRSNDLLVTTMNMFKGQNYQNQGLLLDAFGDWNAQRKRYAAEQNETTKAELNRATEKMMRATVSQLASAALFAASRVVRDLILRKEERLQDENGDLTMESAVKAYGGYYLESVVGCALFGETAYSVIEQIVSSSTDSLLELTGAGSVDDIVEGFGDLYKLMRKNTDDMDAEELKAYHTKVFGALGDMGTAVGQAWGIPIQNLKNIGKAAEKWIEKGLDFDSLPESATGQYDRLYEAILDEDSEEGAAALEKLEGMEKDDKTIFSQLKQRLDMSNADVQEAVQAQLSGDDATRVETTKELIRKIYSTMGIDAKAKADAEKREAVIDTVTGAINREVDNQLKGDGDSVYWEVLEAFENRDAKTMQDEMEKLLTAGKSETSVKSAITAAVKDEYVAGSERDRERIAKVLLSLEKADGTALYEQKALDKWVTDAEKKEEEGEEDEWSELR